MANEWKRTKLGDLIEIKHGWPFKSEFYSDELTGRPIVISIGNFNYKGGLRLESTSLNEYRGDFPPEYLLEAGDVLLVMTCQTPGGEILGIPARIPRDHRKYLHNQRLGKVVLKDETAVDPDFLYWLFLSPAFNRELVSTASGTKILHTAPSRIEAFEFSLPPRNEQSAIARILWGFEEKLELNRKLNKTLEAMVVSLFESWFVDFEPVRAKAEGRDPRLPTQFAHLFPDSFVDSELGSIPGGWSIGKLGNVAESQHRTLLPNEIRGDAPYIALEHMPKKSLSLWEWGMAEGIESGKLEFKKNEILFGKLRPYFHKVGVAPLDGVCSTDIVVIDSGKPAWYGFVLGHVSSAKFVAHTDASSTGTKMPRTNWSEMARYEVVLPTEAIAEQFSNQIRVYIERMQASILENRTLVALRDALLPRLISGELRPNRANQLKGT